MILEGLQRGGPLKPRQNICLLTSADMKKNSKETNALA